MSDPWKDIREAKRMTPKKLYDLLVDADALLAFLWAWENADTDEELHVAYNALPSNLRWATKEE